MKSRFDNVAESYDSILAPLPEEYCRLIEKRFNLNEDSKVIDLGCGSGLLTYVLSRFSNNVEGIDISKKMLQIARAHDKDQKIIWRNIPVEDFNFGHNRYSLIISYESFHLFPNIEKLIQQCGGSLKSNGFLCIGWCTYQWEKPLKNIIVDVFKSFGIEWGEWGYQRCKDFPSIVEWEQNLSNITEEIVKVHTTSHIQDIALYLASIDISAKLELSERMKLKKELEINFKEFLQSEWISGDTSYFINYSKMLRQSDVI